MTMTSVRLAGSLQTLIDSRLDTIERMLMGRVPRQDRLAIVKDVETQIFDILQETGADEPTREDVLAALARLDPPEAYLPEEGEIVERPAVERRPMAVRAIAPLPGRSDSRMGMVSFGFGLSAFLLSLIHVILMMNGPAISSALNSQLIMFTIILGPPFMIQGMGLAGFVLAVVARYRGVWSIIGGVLSPISLLYAPIAGSIVLLFG